MTTDYSQLKGWRGDDLPDGVQALIVMRNFAAACAVIAGNFQQVAREVQVMLDGCDASELSERLQQYPFYRGVMERLALMLESDPVWGGVSDLYRYDAKTLMDLVRGSNTDAIIYLTNAMWVIDGAELPEGLIEVVQKVEADEADPAPEGEEE